MDTEGTVYFQRNADTETQIASITKVMTAIVALENASLDTAIMVSAAAAAIGESSASLKEGDVLTLDQALTAMLVSSGNDAALAIAETLGAPWAVSGQSAVQAFAEKMNEKADQLGMEHSVFENPHGLDFDAYAGTRCCNDVRARYAKRGISWHCSPIERSGCLDARGRKSRNPS